MRNKQKIFFRADAGQEIGYGHFIRTLALADMLKDDFDCVFFTQSPTEYQQKELDKVCRYIELPTDNSKFEIFLDYLQGDEIVILDNYFFTTDYQKLIKNKGSKLACIDDMHDKHYLADIVINHGCSDVNLFSVESYTKLCLGLEWALLRSPFLNIDNDKRRNNPYKTITVCFGGADIHNLTGKYIVNLLENKSIEKIIAIVGDAYSFEKIQNKKLEYRSNLTAAQIVETFNVSDVAILSASTICLEALACGVVVAAGWYVDNQKDFYKELVENKYIIPLDNLLEQKNKNLSNATRFEGRKINLNKTKESFVKIFAELKNKQNYYIDDFSFVDYKDLSLEDHRIIWKERNKVEIRQWMDNPNKFAFESHLNFVSSLSSKECLYWAVVRNGEIVGSVNITPLGETKVERGIFLATQFLEKKGFGTLIDAALDKILRKMQYKNLIAKVVELNIRSLEFHKKVGYNIISKDDKYYYLEKKL